MATQRPHGRNLHVVELYADRTAVPVVTHHPDTCTLDTCPVIDRIATAVVTSTLPAGDGQYSAWFDTEHRLRLSRIGPLPSHP